MADLREMARVYWGYVPSYGELQGQVDVRLTNTVLQKCPKDSRRYPSKALEPNKGAWCC